ncbi:hypothetical protein [Marinoscillum sp. 108]|uniref:hypothetical protein n=1 Tax=Marinoscillum sp. 108 TaxID=2653151 RepID=UPI0012F336A4|nr:hypothetical protein [Marinoscillum sp. 108]VXD13402.1 conserved hypothetical protein [Marinoscillum sp. 108]
MTGKQKLNYWELNRQLVVFGVIAATLIFPLAWAYKFYFPEPLEPKTEKFCYCLNNDGTTIQARLEYYPEDARRTANRILNNQNVEYRTARGIPINTKVFVIKHHDDVTNIIWRTPNFKGELISTSGWVSSNCLHEQPSYKN